MPDPVDYEILYDHEYTARLNGVVRERFGSSTIRSATHVSDLLFCLRKGWARLRVVGDDTLEPETPDDETLLTWAGGLLFEDLVSTGDKQRAMAYCIHCSTVSRVANVPPGEPEPTTCGECGRRWIIGTPDYVIDGIFHEVKQTRKSRRHGAGDALWWIAQLRTYLLFAHRGGHTTSRWGRLVVNWLMGDYGSRKRGKRPTPPRSALDAFKVVFKEGFEDEWDAELARRQAIVEGEEMPPLAGMGDGDERSPAYPWECASCPVGALIACEMFIWDEEGNVRGQEEETQLPDEGEREGPSGGAAVRAAGTGTEGTAAEDGGEEG